MLWVLKKDRKKHLCVAIVAGEECFITQVNQRDVETEKRLKKDLKRTKVLLADAQIMLDHLKSNAPSKREITQLKNQVGTLCWISVEDFRKFESEIRYKRCEQAAYILDLGVLMFCSSPPPWYIFPSSCFPTAGGVRVHLCCSSEGSKEHGN